MSFVITFVDISKLKDFLSLISKGFVNLPFNRFITRAFFIKTFLSRNAKKRVERVTFSLIEEDVVSSQVSSARF